MELQRASQVSNRWGDITTRLSEWDDARVIHKLAETLRFVCAYDQNWLLCVKRIMNMNIDNSIVMSKSTQSTKPKGGSLFKVHPSRDKVFLKTTLIAPHIGKIFKSQFLKSMYKRAKKIDQPLYYRWKTAPSMLWGNNRIQETVKAEIARVE